MIHNSEILNSQHSNFILNKLKTLKRTKIIKKIGISIYDPKELDDFYHHDFDIIQGPFNIIDQRIKKSGWLDQIQKDKKEFHARSIFLQGLLAQNSKKKIPSKFLKWEKFWDDWFNWHNLNALSTTHTCLSFALSEPKINYVIIGVDNVTQVKQIFDLYKKDKVQTNLLNDLKNIIINDQNLIDPRNWKNLVKIGNKYIDDNYPCFITFEAGATHDGLDYAKKLIKYSADSGADAVKFQIFDPDELIADKNLMFDLIFC